MLATLLMGLLLSRLLVGFDTTIYVRTMWGIANGEPMNPLVGTHGLALHGNFILYLLAPFTEVANPVTILIAVHALSLGALVFLITRAILRIWSEGGASNGEAQMAALWAGLVFVAGTPLLLNPYVFDVRPEVIALPFVAGALLRAERRGGFDKWGLILLLVTLSVREEFTIVAASAVLFAPFGNGTMKLRWRLAFATVCGAYLVAYWYGIRPALAPEHMAAADHSSYGFFSTASIPEAHRTVSAILQSKAELLLLVVLSCGATTIWGWRWFAAAMPFVVLMLLTLRQHHNLINYHYSLFIAPGLIVMGVAGLRRHLERGRLKLVFAAGAAAAILSFVMSSTLPGGGRCWTDFWNIEDGQPLAWLTGGSRIASYEESRSMLESELNSDGGLAAAESYGARLAGRSLIWGDDELAIHVLAHQAVPDRLEWAALAPQNWAGLGRALVGDLGFRLVAITDDLALLRRTDDPQELAAYLPQFDRPCDDPLAAWPGVGLVLCGARLDERGVPLIELQRTSSGDPALADTHLTIRLSEGTTWDEWTVLWMLDGLLTADEIPIGCGVQARADTPTSASQVHILIESQGNALVPTDADGNRQSPPVIAVSF